MLANLQGSSVPYELYGIVVHRGTIGQGHYISFIKSNGNWYEINDTRVQRVAQQVVQSQHAYMLFYEAQDAQIPVLKRPSIKKQRVQ